MKPFLACCFVWFVAVAMPLSAGGAGEAPKREKKTCAEMRTAIEEASKRIKYVKPIKVTAGSWGDLPAALRKLPAGAELCGVGSQGQVIVVSPAFGKELESHYAPLFEAVGCKPLKCGITAVTNCGCSSREGVGTVLTDIGAETYTVMYTKLKR